MIFPYYYYFFDCTCSSENVFTLIEESVKNSNGLELIKTDCAQKRLTFSISKTEILYHNSFSPIVSVEIAGYFNDSQVLVKFSLRKSVKALMSIILTFAFIMQIAMFINLHKLLSFELLFLPAFMMLFSVIISLIGLKVSSNEIVNNLFSETEPFLKDKPSPLRLKWEIFK